MTAIGTLLLLVLGLVQRSVNVITTVTVSGPQLGEGWDDDEDHSPLADCPCDTCQAALDPPRPLSERVEESPKNVWQQMQDLGIDTLSDPC